VQAKQLYRVVWQCASGLVALVGANGD